MPIRQFGIKAWLKRNGRRSLIFIWRAPIIRATALALLLIGLLLTIILIILHFEPPDAVEDILRQSFAVSGPGLFFYGHMFQFDTTQQAVTIYWTIFGCGPGYKSPSSMTWADNCGVPGIKVNVYLDGSTLPSFIFNPDAIPNPNKISVRFDSPVVIQGNSFKTTHDLDPAMSHYTGGVFNTAWSDPAFAFPFDSYGFGSSFSAFSPTNNTFLPIIDIYLSDSAGGFSPNAEEVSDSSVFLENGLFNSSETSTSTITFNGTENVPMKIVQAGFHRSPISKVFVLILLVINWALAALSLVVCIIFWNDHSEVPEAILLLPITVILIVPALRTLMSSTIPIGIFIDTLGIFPQMLIIACCLVTILLKVARGQESVSRKRESEKTSQDLEGSESLPMHRITNDSGHE